MPLIPLTELTKRLGKTYQSVLRSVHEGRLLGAVKIEGQWYVDEDTMELIDRRTRSFKDLKKDMTHIENEYKRLMQS